MLALSWFLAGLVVAAGPKVQLGGTPSANSLNLTFPAAQGRLDTGLWLARGETVAITAEGEWTMWDGHFGRSNAIGHRYRVGLYGWGCLMARVGGGQMISVGTGRTFAADSSGTLILSANVGTVGMPAPAGELKVALRGGRPINEVIEQFSHDGFKVTVPAAGEGVITDVYVPADQEVRIDAFGSWQMYDGGPQLGPDGDVDRPANTDVPWGRLVARFGGPTFAVGEDQPVGTSRTLRTTRGGLVELKAAVGRFAGHPRQGALTVVIRGGSLATPEQKQQAEQEAEDYERAMAFLRLNQYRRLLLLPLAGSSPELMKAAQRHAEYLAEHGELTHAEEPPRKGYYGQLPFDRAVAAGFKGTVLNEGIHGLTPGVVAVDGLFSTVHQRIALTDPAATAVGVGVARGKVAACVILTGNLPGTVKQPAAAVYPADTLSGVPTRWNGLEEPSAMPAEAKPPFGTPFSLTVPAGITKLVETRLLDRAGRPVPIAVVAPPAGGVTVVAVPLAPLREQETYTCRVVVVTPGVGQKTAEWRFTTGNEDSQAMPLPRLSDPANPPYRLDR